MDKTTAVIDSPEALGAALCRHVPDMANGFTITTRDSQLQLTVTAEDTRPFMAAMERLLKGKIRQIQRGHQGRVLDEKEAIFDANNRIIAEQQVEYARLLWDGNPPFTTDELDRIAAIYRAAMSRKKADSYTDTSI
ncbi:TPA: hypothetical protein QHC10_004660 [Klebsiella quasipneumoniae subsp. similipneumoniae]|nr:hypothetical protein [Klebsiella quasipneumoniae subsp. similipneumoniae]